ncbi:MAG TPA: hypothetical protein VI958_02470 [Acidobacteriota bacterium]
MYSRLRISILLAVILALAPPVFALSIYDVIQLSQKKYSDKEIIALMEATDSFFELKAEDITRLKSLGVSEKVIREMFKRVPPESEPGYEDAIQEQSGLEQTTPEPPPEYGALETEEEAEPDHNHEHTTGVAPSTRQVEQPRQMKPSLQAARGLRISSGSISEEGSGHHVHKAITLGGIRLFILRDEGTHASIAARAAETVQRLDKAASLGEGSFFAAHSGKSDAIYFRSTSPGKDTLIVSVTVGDARACQKRSGRVVTPDLLAQYWADLLNDYWDIVLFGKPPSRLVNLHEGDALQELYQLAQASNLNGDQGFESAIRQMPRSLQQHLERLASVIPADYGKGGTPHHHEGEEEEQ